MTETQIRQQLDAHQEWLDSHEQRGSRFDTEGEQWTEIHFSGRNISDARLSGCRFVGCHLESCDFSNTTFLSAHFENCRFTKCRFPNADLRGAIADRCDFTGSDFTRADLTDAVLAHNIFEDCIFDWSWLVRTDLRFANLTGVRLENARLLRTKLYNEKRFRFALPAQITVRELDVSPEGNGSLLAGIEGLDRLLELRTA